MLIKGDAKTGSTNTDRDIIGNLWTSILRGPAMLSIKASHVFAYALDPMYDVIYGMP